MTKFVLTPKQARFAREYVLTMNGAEAARRAGYSPKTADRQAFKLLRKAEIRAEISRLQGKTAERIEVSAEKTLRESARIGFSDLRRAFRPDGSLKPSSEWDDDFAAAVASIEVKSVPGEPTAQLHKIRLWPKGEALERLAKHLGLFAADNRQRGATLEELVLAAMRSNDEAATQPPPAPPVH